MSTLVSDIPYEMYQTKVYLSDESIEMSEYYEE